MIERAHARRPGSEQASACVLACLALTLATGCAASLRGPAAPGVFVTTPTRGSAVTLDFESPSASRDCADALVPDLHESLGVMLAFYFCHVPGRRLYSSQFRYTTATMPRGDVPRVEIRWRFELRDERGSLLVDVSGRAGAVIDPTSETLDPDARRRLQDAVLERIRIALRNADLT
jgi:hypothetical protein